MDREAAKKALLNNEQLGLDEIKRIFSMTAGFKRYLEVVTMIPGALDEEKIDAVQFRKKYGISGDYREDASFLLDEEKAKTLRNISQEEYINRAPETVFRYTQFLSNKLYYRDELLNRFCVPKNEKMKKWRSRQIERSKGITGSAYNGNIQLPLAFEISDGCSIGCKFCAIGAEKLKSVFKNTPENIQLFSDIVDISMDIIGEAACSGVLYYCSEPLDNPNYETFAQIMFSKSGMWPQITTAAALRHKERVHRLLEDLNNRPNTIFRFSVLSVEQAKEILEEFSAEELLRVELIPQYPEATTFTGFAKAGRARDDGTQADDGIPKSICCISGFVVNMANRTIRLITMANADDRFPTGEVVYEKASFTDEEDFRIQMTRMIDTYIHNDLPKNKTLKLYDYFTLEDDLMNGKVLRSPGYMICLNTMPGGSGFRTVEALMEGKYTAGEIVSKLTDQYGLDPVDIYWTLHFLWQKGVIDEFYPIDG